MLRFESNSIFLENRVGFHQMDDTSFIDSDLLIQAQHVAELVQRSQQLVPNVQQVGAQ